MSPIGHHYLWDVFGCDALKISYSNNSEKLLEDIVAATNLTIIGKKFNQFAPHGVTGILLLEESHLSIHTWPEHNYAAIDLFSCVELNGLSNIESLITGALNADTIEFKKINRGLAKKLITP